MTTNEERALEAIGRLQAAALEMIAAARAFLDLAEDLVADPAPLLALATAVGELAGPIVERARAATRPGAPTASGDAADGDWDLMARMYRAWPPFRALVDNVQMAMAKADMSIAADYAGLVGDRAVREHIYGLIRDEFVRSEAAILRLTGRARLLDTAPPLRDSIDRRNPYVDPLSYIQVHQLRQLRRQNLPSDERTARAHILALTVRGIAAGVRNTG